MNYARCAGCSRVIHYPDEFSGRRAKCPKCGQVVVLPVVLAAAIPAPPLRIHQPALRDVPKEAIAAWKPPSTAPSTPPPASRPLAAELSTPDRAGPRLPSLAVGWVIALNLLTLNIFSMVWLNLFHGKLPRKREDDPSARRAICMLFVPFYNFYWFNFTFIRLLTRLNEQRAECGLPNKNLRWLVVVCFIMIFVPIAGALLNTLVLIPLLATAIQGSVNALAAISASRGSNSRSVDPLAADLRAGTLLRRTWAVYLLIVCGAYSAFICWSILLDSGSIVLCDFLLFAVHICGVSLPLAVGGASLFWRAAKMVAASRLAEQGDADVAITLEARASLALRRFWFAMSIVNLILNGFFITAIKYSGETSDDVTIPAIGLTTPWLATAAILFWFARSLQARLARPDYPRQAYPDLVRLAPSYAERQLPAPLLVPISAAKQKQRRAVAVLAAAIPLLIATATILYWWNWWHRPVEWQSFLVLPAEYRLPMDYNRGSPGPDLVWVVVHYKVPGLHIQGDGSDSPRPILRLANGTQVIPDQVSWTLNRDPTEIRAIFPAPTSEAEAGTLEMQPDRGPSVKLELKWRRK